MAKKKLEEDVKVESADFQKNASFFKKIKTGNIYAENKNKFNEVDFIDSECYVLNAILSGDIFRGFPNNKIVMLAGDYAVGKTFFTCRNFARTANNLGYFVYYIDTEHAVDESFLVGMGLKEDQFEILRCSTVEDVREQVSTILNTVEDFAKTKGMTPDKMPKVMFVMDSQGNLVTRKSIIKTNEGKDTKDMTKQVELKRFYGELTNRMGLYGIPFVLTNHVYVNIGGYGDPKVVAGGTGSLYNSSIILGLSKAKVSEGEGAERVRKGSVITLGIIKSRFVREQTTVRVYLPYDEPMNKYWGLHEIAQKANLIEEYNEKVHTEMGVVKPTGLGNSKKMVIMDPVKQPSDWIVCKQSALHREDTIGTILNPINDWVKANFTLPKHDSVLTLGSVPEEDGEEEVDSSLE